MLFLIVLSFSHPYGTESQTLNTGGFARGIGVEVVIFLQEMDYTIFAPGI